MRNSTHFSPEEREKFIADYLEARADGVTSKRKAYAVARVAAVNEQRRYPSLHTLLEWTLNGRCGMEPCEEREKFPRAQKKVREIAEPETATEERIGTEETDNNKDARLRVLAKIAYLYRFRREEDIDALFDEITGGEDA